MKVEVRRIYESIWLIENAIPGGGFEKSSASYLLLGGEKAIIESGPACSAQPLVETLKELNIDLSQISYVIATHIHLDHAGGFGHLAEALPNAVFMAHPRGIPHLAAPQKLWESASKVLGPIAERFGEPKPVPKDRLKPLRDGEVLNLKGLRLRVIETLGHASHHLSFLEEENQTLFPGDSCGIYFENLKLVKPSTPPGADINLLVESLGKMQELNARCLAFTHYGISSQPDEILAQLRRRLYLWLTTALEGFRKGETPEQVFREIFMKDEGLRLILKHWGREEPFTRSSIKGLMAYLERKGVEAAEEALKRLKI